MFVRTMQKSSRTRHTDNPLKLFGVIVPYLPILLLRSGAAWLSFRGKAQKGAKIFQQELVRQGIDKETAMMFTQSYAQGNNLIDIFKKF